MAEVQARILKISMATGIQFCLCRLNLNPEINQGSFVQLLAIVVLSLQTSGEAVRLFEPDTPRLMPLLEQLYTYWLRLHQLRSKDRCFLTLFSENGHLGQVSRSSSYQERDLLAHKFDPLCFARQCQKH